MDTRWIANGLSKPGKTQKGLADALGISAPAVSNMLRGKRRVRVDEVPKIAAYLGVEPPVNVGDQPFRLPDDDSEAAVLVVEYVLERSNRHLEPREKVRFVAEFRDLIARARSQ